MAAEMSLLAALRANNPAAWATAVGLAPGLLRNHSGEAMRHFLIPTYDVGPFYPAGHVFLNSVSGITDE